MIHLRGEEFEPETHNHRANRRGYPGYQMRTTCPFTTKSSEYVGSSYSAFYVPVKDEYVT